jgi:CheY-like chemotaxis protein
VPSLLEECAAAVLDGSGVRMVMTVEPDLPFVLGDRSQLAQVIQNLLVNARQAMPGGGTVHVRAARAGDGDPGEAPGIALVIEDEGPGVPPEIAARVFDPYFTTRRGGNGMGLAIAQSVVVRHGGRIALGPPGDRGARFVLHLPGTHERPPDPEALAPVAPPPAGRVLILDDDETVLEVTADLMAALGFEPHLAREGREAIATFLAARDQGRPFCLAILDLTVPGGLGGRETLAGLRGIDPAVRAIVSSGYSDDPVLADFRAYGFAAAARKPFTLDELRARVAEALGVF